MADMQTHQLTAHGAFAPIGVTSVTGKIGIVGPWLQLRWKIEGSAKLVLPPFTGRQRRDELWRTTCFELFTQPEFDRPYCELNLSPSEGWAAYDFTSRREGMAHRPMSHDPVITPRVGNSTFIMDAAIPLSDLPSLPMTYALTCVLEEEGGILSYWAMEHGGDRPDFHDPACFGGRLAAPEAP